MRENAELSEMRQMLQSARERFRIRAAPFVLDEEARAFVEGLTAAIGDISVDEAWAALERWRQEKNPPRVGPEAR